MSNAFATNFSIPSISNTFQCIWKLTRVMKAAGWVYKASGDGTNKDTTGTAANDLWGGSSNPLLDSYTSGNQLASTTLNASTTFPVSSATVSVTSTSGFNTGGGIFYVNGNVNGVTYTGIAGNTFTGCNGGPSLTSSTDTIKAQPALSDSTVGWAVYSGPQTIKIALNGTPTGVPVRGEIVTQATSGATGELFGYVWDTVGLSGWAVIGPQTGTWNGVNTFTGAISGATLTPLSLTTSSIQSLPTSSISMTSTVGLPPAGVVSITTGAGIQTVTYTGISGGNTLTGASGGTGNTSNGGLVTAAPVTFNREICFAKTAASTVAGYIFYICADPVTESSLLLSFLATQTGCTALIPPGGGGTNNVFNTNSPVTGVPEIMCVRGTNTATGQFTTPDNWFAYNTNFGSNSQIAAVNCTPSSNITADGSFWIGLSTTTAGQYTGFFYGRIDDSDSGDCDPYVFFQTNSICTISATPGFSRIAITGQANSITWSYNVYGLTPWVAGQSCYFGYQSRGNTTVARDVPCSFFGALNGSNFLTPVGPVLTMFPTVTLRQVCTPATTAPAIREPISLYNIGSSSLSPIQLRQSKGRLRWVQATGVGNVLDTFDSKTWLCIATYGGEANYSPGVLLGPYDGSTTPIA